MTKGISREHAISEKARVRVLVFFSAFFWGVLWSEVQQLIMKVLNISYEGLFLSFFGLNSLPPGKRTIIEQQFRAGLLHDFYWPHFLLVVIGFLIVPLIVGFYLGKHSEKNRFLNCFFVVILITFFSPLLNLIVGLDFSGFMITVFFKLYLVSPALFLLCSFGALLGSYSKNKYQEGLYLSFYRNLLEKKRSGLVPAIFMLAFSFLSIRGVEKEFFDWLSPYFKYGYAKIEFAGSTNALPFIQVLKPSSGEIESWRKFSDLQNGDELAFAILVKNNNYIYKAVNARLSFIRKDNHNFSATLWADNAKPIKEDVRVNHNCGHPVFSFLSGDLKFIHTANQQTETLARGLKGEEFLRSGLQIGDAPGMYAGASNVIIKMKFSCSD